MRAVDIVDLSGCRHTKARDVDGAQLWLRCGNTGDLGPDPESLGTSDAILGNREAVTAELEEVADLVVGGEEALCLPG